MYSIGGCKVDYLAKFVDGLIGLGFDSFSDIQELNAFRKFVRELTKDALNGLLGKKKEKKSTTYNPELSIAENIEALLDFEDKLDAESLEKNCKEIVSDIEQIFKTDTESISELLFIKKKSKEELINLRKDYDAIEIFSLIAGDALSASEKDTILSKLKEIITTYKFYMNTCIQTEAA